MANKQGVLNLGTHVAYCCTGDAIASVWQYARELMAYVHAVPPYASDCLMLHKPCNLVTYVYLCNIRIVSIYIYVVFM